MTSPDPSRKVLNFSAAAVLLMIVAGVLLCGGGILLCGIMGVMSDG